MSKHSKIGIKGEQIAADFLLNKGYTIIYRNWRTGKKEVDIVAEKAGLVVMVEVKTRSGAAWQYPEEAVDKRKQTYLKAAAEAFLEENTQYRDLRFDIIAVLMDGGDVREVVHFEEAFN